MALLRSSCTVTRLRPGIVSPALRACETWISIALLRPKASSTAVQTADSRALRGWAAICGVRREARMERKGIVDDFMMMLY